MIPLRNYRLKNFSQQNNEHDIYSEYLGNLQIDQVFHITYLYNIYIQIKKENSLFY